MLLSIVASLDELKKVTASLRVQAIEEAAAWAGISQTLLDAFQATFGLLSSLRMLALLPVDVIHEGLNAMRKVTTAATADAPAVEEPLTAVATVQMAGFWLVAIQAFRTMDGDPLLPHALAASTMSSSSSATPPVTAPSWPSRRQTRYSSAATKWK